LIGFGDRPYQSLDSFAVYRNAFAVQINLHLSAAIKRVSQKPFVYEPHKFQVLFIFNLVIPGPVV